MADFSKVQNSMAKLKQDVEAFLAKPEDPAIQAGIDAIQGSADSLDAEVVAKLNPSA